MLSNKNWIDYLNKSQEVKKIQQEMDVIAEEAFSEGCKTIFNTYPEVKEFSFNCYTPYFNDGDPCYFQVDGPYINGGGYTSSSEEKAYKDIEEFMSAFGNDGIEALFEDGSTVTITPEGTEVEKYEHD